MSDTPLREGLAPIATKILYEDDYVRVWNQVVPAGADLPPFDVFAPLLSLPGLFGTTWGSVPPPLPYAVRRAA